MDEESKRLLQSTFKLAEENNKMLHHIKRAQKFTVFMNLFYWFVVFGIGLGLFYFLQPYVDGIQKFVGGPNGAVNSLKGISPKQ